jgi:glycosyltransferase involved in cell wall biosynthesis
MMTRRLVISAVNFSEGGPLTVLRECIQAARAELSSEWEIIALVHDRNLIETAGVRLLEFPDSKRSWLRRLYHEFVLFARLSRELRPDVWFSLHDITPRVIARRRVVYCHNASPFYRMPLSYVRLDPTQFLFSNFYGHLYRINIRQNDLIVVQQDWMRQEFRRLYGVENIAVAHPVVAKSLLQAGDVEARREVFLYPALPRVFKNVEVLGTAAEILLERIGPLFEVRLTMSGDENPYARYLYRKFGASPVVKFIGRQNAAQMAAQYKQAGAIVMASLLESWGLPISEGKMWLKPLLLADLPYAHEALGEYEFAAFFSPQDPSELAELMYQHLQGTLRFHPHSTQTPDAPFAPDWPSLIKMVVDLPAE